MFTHRWIRINLIKLSLVAFVLERSETQISGFHYFLKSLMRRQQLNNLHCGKARNILPPALQSKIQTQVSERPQNFIHQILHQGSTFASSTFPQCFDHKMESDMEKLGSKDLSPQNTLHKERASHDTECSFEEAKDVSFSEQDAKHPDFPLKQGKGKRRRNERSESSDDARPPKRKAPNYFMSVQITDPQIHSAAKRVQEGILQASDVDISSTRIDPIKFHLTLMVMHLEDEDAVKRAEEVVVKLGPILAEKFEGREVALEFKGVSVFGGGRVVFTPPLPSQGLNDLHAMADEVSAQMNANGIYSTDGDKKVFNPHLTLFKFKNDQKLFKQGIRKIKESLYAPFKEEHFGVQKISSIQLCEMSEEKRDDGYYLVNKEVDWRKMDT